MRESGANSLVMKILPPSACCSKIFSRFSPNPMIPRDQGGGGVPLSTPRFPFREFAILILIALFSTGAAFAQALEIPYYDNSHMYGKSPVPVL